jgi:hypothetical protein
MTAPINDPARTAAEIPAPHSAPAADAAPLKRVEFPPIPEPGPLPSYTVEPLHSDAATPAITAPPAVTAPAVFAAPPAVTAPPVATAPPVFAAPPAVTAHPVAAAHPAAAAPPAAPAPPVAPAGPKTAATLIAPFLVACLVAAGLGVYGKLHEPTGIAVNVAGFSSPATVKVWLATLAFALAVVQLFTALVMYGKLPVLSNATWLGPVHRWSGRLAFLASIPVALHCLYALGFDDYDTRVLLHSLLGCFFYGAFAAKMLILARKGVPNWALPLFGGLVFTALSGLFVTSALWFFTTFGVKL